MGCYNDLFGISSQTLQRHVLYIWELYYIDEKQYNRGRTECYCSCPSLLSQANLVLGLLSAVCRHQYMLRLAMCPGAAGTEPDTALPGFHCSFLLLPNGEGQDFFSLSAPTPTVQTCFTTLSAETKIDKMISGWSRSHARIYSTLDLSKIFS